MILVYTGKQPAYPVRGQTFDRNTPTHTSGLTALVIDKQELEGFEVYQPGKNYDGPKRPIYVFLPNELHLFIPALKAINRIKEWFPLSPIKVSCRSEFECLLPNSVTVEPLTSALKPYRVFNLLFPKQKITEIILSKANCNYERALMQHCGLYDIDNDHPKSHKHHDLLKCDVVASKPVVIRCDKEVNGIYELLSELIGDFIEIRSGENESLKENYEKLKYATYVISCGVTELSWLVGYMGKSGYVFVPSPVLRWQDDFKALGLKGSTMPETVDRAKIEEFIRSIGGESYVERYRAGDAGAEPKPRKGKKTRKQKQDDLESTRPSDPGDGSEREGDIFNRADSGGDESND